ncbi:MAG: TIGR00725 family protein [Candidatus Saliniplasma sp.]
MYVSVIGGDIGSCTERDCERAEKLGKGIAELDMVLVCGGRGGVMEYACRGAKSAGGTTIGILPSGDRKEGNEYLDHAIVTKLGMLRNSLVVLNGDIVVAVDGGYGTLSEISMANKYGKRILGIGSWDVDAVEGCSSVEEVLEKLKIEMKSEENTKSL